MLYANASLSVRAVVAPPRRHCSPVNVTSRDVIVPPVLFVKRAPTVGLFEPLLRLPNARSDDPPAPKEYVSPAVTDPVPALYDVLAVLPVGPATSANVHPAGVFAASVPVDVATRPLKSWVYAVSSAVSAAGGLMLADAGVATATSPVVSSANAVPAHRVRRPDRGTDMRKSPR